VPRRHALQSLAAAVLLAVLLPAPAPTAPAHRDRRPGGLPERPRPGPGSQAGDPPAGAAGPGAEAALPRAPSSRAAQAGCPGPGSPGARPCVAPAIGSC